MSPGATFERVYFALKSQLLEGRRLPGTPLEPKILGEELAASNTPVRDALHRLVGEGLVEAPDHNGFNVPRITEAGLRDLYGWNGQILRLAARSIQLSAGVGEAERDDRAADVASATAAFFLRLGSHAGNSEHLRAIAHLNDRLASCRRAEAKVLTETAAELAGLETAHSAGDRSALVGALARYHRRRTAAVLEIVAQVMRADRRRRCSG